MQNENTVSQKLDRIDSALDRIRTKTDTSGNVIEDVASAVESLVAPEGNINITNTSSTDVTNYATAQVVDTNLIADNIKKDTTILGITGSYEGGGGTASTDWSQIGYSAGPQTITNGFNYAKQIYDNWDNSTTSLYEMFKNDTNLIYMPLVNTSNVTYAVNAFYECYNLENMPQLNLSNATYCDRLFYRCEKLKTIPQIDLSSCISSEYICYLCLKLESIAQLNFSSNTKVNSMFYGCSKLELLGGFLNLGQAYLTIQPANFIFYILDLSTCSLLTHDSLMNVINNLYDIATKGCNTQSLKIGATNLAKLTAEEIAIATNKGWSVS